jgi:4'-phosphopantetheinyl transferase
VKRAIAASGDGPVHVWRGSLRLPTSRLAALASTLSLEERERMRATLSPLERRRFIASRGQLRLLLARYLGGSPKAVPLLEQPNGRPILASMAGQPPLHFSVSHTGDDVVYAVTAAGAVGIDLERARPELDWRGLATRFFAPEDMAQMRRPSDFYRLWTRKEAMAKVAGGSLLAWLRTDLGSALTPDWRLWSWSVPNGAASVALRTGASA